MAKQAEISPSTLIKVEKGDATISIGVYAKIMFILGLDKNLFNTTNNIGSMIENIENKINLIEKKFSSKIQNSLSTKPPKHTLKYMLDTMLTKANNCKSEERRKRNFIKKMFINLKLSENDDYSKFYTTENIQKISENIKNLANEKNDSKRRKLRYIKEFVNCAYNIEPDFYKNNLILNFPKIEKTKKCEQHPHLPYSEGQLKEIFSPKYKFFKNNPDTFWICMIALFTGARANAAITLQFKDIIIYEGIKCIYFRENHFIKKLKNEASERIVPIHQQLLDLGFWNYIERRKAKYKTEIDDFIFPRCKTKNGNYNNKYMLRTLFVFLEKIKIKEKGYDFHSFRKNASIAMQSAGLIPSIINAIIGWEGKNTMETSYSNYTTEQINTELNKFNYYFLKKEFDKWKKIMAKK